MKVIQKTIKLKPFPRGFHLVTGLILEAIPELKTANAGILQVFIQHTSAALAINENADPTVRQDMEAFFSRAVRENEPYYLHTMEGPDDMPAHIKSVMIGSSVSIPITNGQPNLGTWQGIYLCEHRDHGGPRSLVLTYYGD